MFKRDMVADTAAGKARQARLKSSGERWLAPLPMFHAYVSSILPLKVSFTLRLTQYKGQAYYAITAARSGVKVFIMPKYEPVKYLLYLDIYRITFLTGVPTLLVTLSKHPEAKNFNLHAIEAVVTGSAPLSPEIGKFVADSLLRPGVLVKQGWGLTECTCSATGFAQDDVDDGRSIGWLNPNVSARIVPVPDQEFGRGSGITHPIGEIWISGPNIIKGYYNRPEETANTIIQLAGKRWLRTGDVGYVDDRGCLYIIDRLKVSATVSAPDKIEDSLLHLGTHQSKGLTSRTRGGRTDPDGASGCSGLCRDWSEEVQHTPNPKSREVLTFGQE
jgi:4-coumarate--CoA ligase